MEQKSKQPRQYKRHTLLRRKEAKKANFAALDLPGKFAMILRQRTPSESYQLSNLLTHEEKLQFFRDHYKGFKVSWGWRRREGLLLSPVKIVTLGFALQVNPKIKNVRYSIDLVSLKEQLNEAETLKTIQKYLPTVVAI